MDIAVRILRDGTADGGGAAPLLLLCDALETVGEPAVLRHAVADLAAAIASGRSQAGSLTLVALERPPAHYQQLVSLTAVNLTILDCFSDAYGWGSLLAAADGHGSSGGGRGSVVPLPGILTAAGGMHQLRQHLLGAAGAADGARQCIVIDSVSPLLDRFGPARVVQLLQDLQAAPATSSLLLALHTDLHPPQHLAALEQLAAGSLTLQPASELERSLCAAKHGAACRPQGKLAVRLKRRTGRVRAETQMYCVDGGGAVSFMEPPADALNPQALAEKTAAAACAGGDGALAAQLAGGMKLGLSAAELEAKQRVQLPFEHQGQGAAYQTGDFRDYLPPEAGGRARPPSAGGAAALPVGEGPAAGSGAGPQQAQQLGRIMYVRDSGSEHDSDEDPDDDLDI